MIKIAVAPALLAAGTACAPLAQADPGQAGLSQPFSEAGAAYVGEWGAHGEHLSVNSDGTGTETSRYGTVTFRMSTVQSQGQPNTAYGNVSGGGRAEPGAYITMRLVDGGNGLLLRMANGDNNFPFCNRSSTAGR